MATFQIASKATDNVINLDQADDVIVWRSARQTDYRMGFVKTVQRNTLTIEDCGGQKVAMKAPHKIIFRMGR